MLRMRTGARHGLRRRLFALATVTALLTLSSRSGVAAPYADIMVDGNSGKVLHATNPDARRHPASLTKIMTLYLLFEKLEAGKLKLNTPLKVSEEAAEQSPTKLGLKAGSTIQVEDAIKGMVTRSANDMAIAIGEGRPHRCSMEAALHAVDVMTGILKSGETGKFVAMQTTCERPAALGVKEARALLTKTKK